MTDKRNEKNWAKVLDDCCKSNAELVEQIADLKAENKDYLEVIEQLQEETNDRRKDNNKKQAEIRNLKTENEKLKQRDKDSWAYEYDYAYRVCNEEWRSRIEKAIDDFTTSPDYNYEKYTAFTMWNKMLSRVQELLHSSESEDMKTDLKELIDTEEELNEMWKVDE